MPIKEALDLFFEKNLSESRDEIFNELNELAVKRLDEQKRNIAESMFISEAKDEEDEEDDDDEDDEDDEDEVNEARRKKAPKWKEDPFKVNREAMRKADEGKPRYKKDGTLRKRQPAGVDIREEEQIDELSTKTLKSYMKKSAADDSFEKAHNARFDGDKEAQAKYSKKANKRLAGYKKAKTKVARREMGMKD
jgi:hypothetical protein